ncbi:hypothetical protein HanIR_Chr05g0250191 [Helianthus annuus]|nr:hypothetical protein HanIR_Chr05g0250191 [Helianthus annuus]
MAVNCSSQRGIQHQEHHLQVEKWLTKMGADVKCAICTNRKFLIHLKLLPCIQKLIRRFPFLELDPPG